MERLAGAWAAIVARLPMPINNSASPVMTSTRRRGWVRATPSPSMLAPPNAPQK